VQLGAARACRRGIIWHTQGSGKSLTILFACAQAVDFLGQPTIIIVVDRDQLQDQMVKQFRADQHVELPDRGEQG